MVGLKYLRKTNYTKESPLGILVPFYAIVCRNMSIQAKNSPSPTGFLESTDLFSSADLIVFPSKLPN